MKQIRTLHLFKQHLKFSAAHFLIFDETHAEKLHGHNYQVQLDIVTHSLNENEDKGYLVDFGVLKREIKNYVDLWDEKVLLPEKNKEMIFQKEDSHLKVFFRNRRYLFPEDEVVKLPISNTSVELLSELLAKSFLPFMKTYPIKSYTVRVDETPGQGASYLLEL